MIRDYLEGPDKKELETILSAFVTFKTEEGYNEALRFMKNPQYLSAEDAKLLGKNFKIEEADEPGNIIWECKHIKGWNLYKRLIMGLGLVAILLVISFTVIVQLQI